jgi:hypothetical protein
MINTTCAGDSLTVAVWICLQIFFEVDEAQMKEYKAVKQQQQQRERRQQQQPRKRRPIASRRAAAAAAAAAASEGGDDDDSSEDEGPVQPADVITLDSEARNQVIFPALQVVGPRCEDGTFLLRTEFQWVNGWEAFLRTLTRKVQALQKYSNCDFDRLYRAVKKNAHQ